MKVSALLAQRATARTIASRKRLRSEHHGAPGFVVNVSREKEQTRVGLDVDTIGSRSGFPVGNALRC